MKEIAQRVWHEPAVAIGLLISIALAVVAIINGDDWGWEEVLFVVGPLLAALGIRPFVTPVKDATQPPPVSESPRVVA
jgi:hypothetical protein